MCTMIVEKADIYGSGKGPQGWFRLVDACPNVSFDQFRPMPPSTTP